MANETFTELLYPLDYPAVARISRGTLTGAESVTTGSSVAGEVFQRTGTVHQATPGSSFDTRQHATIGFYETTEPATSVESFLNRTNAVTVAVASMRDAFTLQVSFESAGVPTAFDPANVGAGSNYSITGLTAETAAITVTAASSDHVDHPAYLYLTFSSPPVTGQTYTVTTSNLFYTFAGLVSGFSITFVATEWGRTSVLKSFMPTALDPAQPNLNALLTALGYGDEWIGGAAPGAGASRVRLGTTVSDALGDDLNRVGTSYSVPRPTMFSDDETYRSLIGLMGVSLKATRLAVSAFLRATLDGTWELFELTPGELILALDVAGVTGTMASASYLHADATEDSTSTYYGDYLQTDVVATDWGVSATENPARAVHIFEGDARQLQAIDLLKEYMLAAGVRLRVVYNVIPTNNQSGLPSILPFTLPNT